ncbi:hypothetical protein BH20ACI4_BH20ACI4_15890 [soil metagenome]
MSETIQQEYPPIVVKRLSGDEYFQYQHGKKEMSVIKFWQWFGSDLSNNVIRGALAEFIVASALNIADGVRDMWSSFDLLSKENIKIEVKSSAYLQSWHQRKLSSISFDIGQSVAYDSTTKEYENEAKRQADIYVFCLLHFTDKLNLNPLDLDQWEFFILRSTVLNEKHLTQSKLSLSGLLKLAPLKTDYKGIEKAIKDLTGEKTGEDKSSPLQ